MEEKAKRGLCQGEKQGDNRKIYLDLVKIFAIFLVFFTHTGIYGPKNYTNCHVPYKQFLYLMVDCFRTINNPLLFMVSGALLLGKNESIEILYKKRVFRFIVVLFVFSFFQVFWQGGVLEESYLSSIVKIVKNIIQAPVKTSYWYLYAYISFLVMLPFLRAIAQKMDSSQFLYLVVSMVVVKYLFPIFRLIFGLSNINFSVALAGENLLYPLIGYYLDKHWEESEESHRWVYPALIILSVVALLAASGLTLYDYHINKAWSEKYIVIFRMIVAMTFFVSIKKYCYFRKNSKRDFSENFKKIVTFISGTTFGMYLLEKQLTESTMNIFFFAQKWMPTIFADCIWIVSAMLMGGVIVGVMKKIPIVKKFL